MKKVGLLFLSVSALLLGACGNSTASTEDGKLDIVTTFYPVYEFTKQVTGDEANVELLVKAGTEVHGYEPSAKDIARIQEADAFVYENENMETWVHDVEKSLDTTKVNVISATEGMLLLPGGEEEHEGHDHSEEGHSHAYDPHVWLSPERAITLVENIRDSLVAKYPEKKDAFETNAAAYIEKLDALDAKYSETLSAAKQKYFVTQHTAFAYLALDYGLKQVSITGVAADEDPTPSRLAELTEYINKYGIKYIYFEENASKSVAETLAKETGVQLDVLNPLESLTDEDMKNGKDYISVMEDNLTALEKTTSQEGSEILPEEGAETAQTVYNGYFEDSAVKDRTLSDYAGEWQSVYPYLLDGTLDQVWDYKAKIKGGMTAEEYKAYYDTGYKTDVDQINITDNTMEFVVGDKKEKFTYKYVGYKILTYKKGNRGVRFLFEATDANAGNYKYVQFSDHNIAPVKTGHFHIYFGGESQEKLLEELENWPTYYPVGLTGLEIGQEMLAH
ncbi:TPA: zinc ABC transporter substrate-binding protein AdcA [Streptococcus suis]|uniref:zinc ABC transporter substrate-binding protein AdcA n=3 Tax=Streptococcus suis TaxID=1307 RepID=UPI001583D208|nr:zinc ABC transporter substrate-binding protein AdcA [Streptococcus suis]MCK3891330.1 zinc ABC transporter substrate-binding protein AdcA [Streptococcus suis]HEM4283680.1 zinc ABC transporter substrate-binding protein AdcA [Streptococcus suis]HEM4597944.1 zinc ABC transporter substrate-binding protein AdcA [Streptococcus suis]HEM6234345.1 zinc ABC transporter substrate-binding protein AdcA [Streptococcus suis]HEM6335765.1 zinc ABC transporter substrate-binding protein AdcA [Streptococcus sui